MTSTPETAGAIGFLKLPELFGDLLLRKATGQLVVFQNETIKKIFFKTGYILYATSNLPADQLGDALLVSGKITRDQYDESARQVIATGRKQGTILVQIGALAPNDLFRGVIAQVREIVLSTCGWDRGSWQFFDRLPPQEEFVSLRLHPADLIFEGLASIAADRRWSSAWDPRRLDLRLAADAPFAIDQIEAPDAARRLLTMVGEGRSLQEMARLIGRDDGSTTALLYGLTLLRLIEARPRPAAPVAAAPAPAPAVKAPTPAPAATQPGPPDEAHIRSQREKITSLAGRLETYSHYQILGLHPESDADAIKRSYIALAKEFHPDRYFRPEFDDLKQAIDSIFMRINEAYSTLHNPAAREEYDRETARRTTPVAREKQPAEDSHLAKEQFAKGLALLNSGDVWSGIQALRWAVNLAPQDPYYHTWLGVALMRSKKRLHEAEEHCKIAIALDHSVAQYYVHLGQVYKTGHLYEKARQQFETALRLDPKHPGALKEIRELEPPPEKGLFDRFMKK